MADITYTVNKDTPQSIPNVEIFSQEDTSLVNTFQVNQLFDSTKHSVELHIYNLAGELQESITNYINYKELGNAASAGKQGASVLTIDPIEDVKAYGYDNGGVKLFYNFINDLYTENRSTVEFFIDSISPDRTELKLKTFNLTPEEILSFTSAVKTRLETQSYFSEFRVNLQNNELPIGVNIDTLEEVNDTVVVVKLYDPLPEDILEKSTLNLVELVSDSVVYEVTSVFEIQEEPALELRSPNFNLDLVDENVVPTGYYNYDTLLSLPISNTTNELYSLVNSKGVQLSIDHNDYSNFIHFSSAQERLLNFKYKLDLIESYTTQITDFQGITTPSLGTTGSITYYQDLIKGIVSNFDHYERFLYYESGSNSWPKTNNTKPYINDTTTVADTWFNDKLTVAATYDVTNTNILIDSIPSYLRDDSNNASYITFIHMIGQHFDNMWIYAKGVSDKYDADNRLDFGISRDLIAEVLKNFGVKLYTSNRSIEDLFSSFIGQAYQSGSEVVNNYVTGSVIGSNDSIQPSSFDNYQKEVYKRMYHNLPLLLKSKGTERGLRALINCFGIPSDILDIKLYGGRSTDERPFYGDYQHYTSSLDKVRTDHTGSTISGSTLSQYTSTLKRNSKYTDDLHNIEVGFSPTDNIDKYIISKSLADTNLATFNIDDYIGNPSSLTLNSYEGLYAVAEEVLGDLTQYDVRDFIRLIKFFDNTIFKMVKDFIPARTVADTGIIIKPNLLNRSKAKSVKATVDTIVSASIDNAFNYTSSIDTAFTEGNHGDTFGAKVEYKASYLQVVETPQGEFLSSTRNREEAKFDGEFANSTITVTRGELNSSNILKKAIPPKVQFDLRFYQQEPGNLCTLDSTTFNEFIVQPNIPYPLGPMFGTETGLSAPSNTEYFLGYDISGTPIPPVYTFTGPNYTDVTIYGQADDDCFEKVRFRIVTCSLGPVQAPSYIVAGTTYDLSNWFTLNLNLDVKFQVQRNNETPQDLTLPPYTYQFNGSTGDTFKVTVIDKVDTNCRKTVEIQFYTCLIQPEEYTTITEYVGEDIDFQALVVVPDYFSGELPTSQYKYQPVIPQIYGNSLAPILSGPWYDVEDPNGFPLGARTTWMKLINVEGSCERIIKISKIAQSLAIRGINLHDGGSAHAVCYQWAPGQYSQYNPTVQVYYEDFASAEIKNFLELWSENKLLRKSGNDAPLNGWYSDGQVALYYTSGYPNRPYMQSFNYNTTTGIACSTVLQLVGP